MEEIDFNDQNAAFDRLLQLANCVDEKENLMGELDGLCAYAIAKYPVLCENEWSGYEVMKMRVLSVLKNRRNSKRKRTEDD